jgi:uncharacterized membrane protein YraQ (UPF0718 family)
VDLLRPIQRLADLISYRVLGLDPASALGRTVDFFLSNAVQVLLLLALVVFVVAVLKSFVRPERTRRLLSGSNLYLGNVLAALLGIATPLCSGSSVPVFMGLVESGVPLGVTFSFLISAPTVNEVALALLLVLFGWKVTLVYLVAGLTVSVLGGILLGALHLESLVEPYAFEAKGDECEPGSGWRGRSRYAWRYTADVLREVWLWVLGGIAVGALLQGYVPTGALVRFAGAGNPFAVPAAVALGVPLYMNAAGVVPIVSVLVHKGVAVGTVLAFMMGMLAVSVPEFVILRKVLKTRLIVIYAGLVFVLITAVGYLMNWLVPLIH